MKCLMSLIFDSNPSLDSISILQNRLNSLFFTDFTNPDFFKEFAGFILLILVFA